MSNKGYKIGNKALLNAINGELTTKIPVWFMRQAGRYLPEYQEVRQNKTFEELVQNPDTAACLTLQPVERFNLDGAIIFSDILIPLYAMNRGFKIKMNEGPILEKPIRSPHDVESLEIINQGEAYPYLKESIRKVKKILPQNVALIGFSGAPFTLASYLIEGKSTRDGLLTKAFAYNYPKEYNQLLDKLTEIIILQLQSQADAGVDVVQIFDSWAGHLSLEQYRCFAFPYTQKVFTAKYLEKIPKIHFAQGAGSLISEFVKINAQVLSIDTSLDIENALNYIPEAVALQGNLDPAILLSNEKVIQTYVNKLLSCIQYKKGYIFNLGKGIEKDTPVSNVNTMIETIRMFNRLNGE